LLGGILKRNRHPIGIDFGANSIKMLQLANERAGCIAAAAARVPLPGDILESGDARVAILADLIREAIDKSDMVGRDVICCLPATSVQYKNLRLPRMPADELAKAVEWEAADRLKLDLRTTRLQFFDAGEVKQGDELRQEIILMAVPMATVDEHVEAFLACGLRPLCFEAVPSALARSVGSKPTDEGDDSIQAILDVGFSSSKVLIVRRGRVVFFKLIDIGGRALDESVAAKLNVPLSDASDLRRQFGGPEAAESESAEPSLIGVGRRESTARAVHEAIRGPLDELVREVGLCLRYFSVTFRGRRPGVVKLAGGEACEQQIVRLFDSAGHIRIEPVVLSDHADLSRLGGVIGTAGPHSEWSLAMGLAMWRPPTRGGRSAA